VLDTPFDVAGTPIHVGLSIGVSIYPIDARDRDQLLRNADTAMYIGKGLGDDSPQLEQDGSRGRLALIARLRGAVDNEQFELHYQPIVDLETQTLTLTCRNGTVQIGEYSVDFPQTEEFPIPLDEASRSGTSGTISPSNLALHVIPQAKSQQRLRIQSLEEHMAALAAYQMITGDFATLASPGWSKDQRLVTEARQRLYRLEMEPYRRWSDGFSCLCFVVVGAPLAILMRNSDFLTSFFMCFLPILIIYYPLMMFGVSQAKSGSFPSYGVWAGNLILAIIGTYCIRRVCRY
jgi:lipopolysaccharide export system permease protein